MFKDTDFKFLEDAEPFVNADGFWYSLFEGGYLDPQDYLKPGYKTDLLLESIKLLRQFREQMETKGLVEEM